MTIESMKQALAALERGRPQIVGVLVQQDQDAAIHAIRAAIEQAEQEPRCAVIVEVFGKDWRLDYMSLPVGKHKLYTQEYVYTAQPQQDKQEPRQWVGLTEEEIFKVENAVPDEVIGDSNWCVYFAKAIEAKLKEKNT